MFRHWHYTVSDTPFYSTTIKSSVSFQVTIHNHTSAIWLHQWILLPYFSSKLVPGMPQMHLISTARKNEKHTSKRLTHNKTPVSCLWYDMQNQTKQNLAWSIKYFTQKQIISNVMIQLKIKSISIECHYDTVQYATWLATMMTLWHASALLVLCVGNPPVISRVSSQRANNADLFVSFVFSPDDHLTNWSSGRWN